MTQEPTFTKLPKQNPGETDKEYERRICRWIAGDDIRSKADLRDWTGSMPFHLNKETT